MIPMLRVSPVCGVAALALGLAACKFPELAPIDEMDAGGDAGEGGIDADPDAMPCEGDRYGFAV